MSTATFKVRGRLDSAGPEKEGTLTIDRESGKVTVRSKRSHTTYETTLNRVADWICQTGFRSIPGGVEDE